MPKLIIENFSCITKAEMELGEMTIIIGPQASGKSVISKLFYFFVSLIRDQYQFIEEGKKLESFKDHIREKFEEWFPPSAWGGEKFCIDFVAGKYEIRLTRVIYKGVINDEFRIHLSPFIKEHYQDLSVSYNSASKKKQEMPDWEALFQLTEISQKKLSKELGKNYFQNQLFIPAGRSFFTNIGKAVAAFEQTRMLDPLTTIFGRSFATSRERSLYRQPESKSRTPLAKLTEEILGGKIKLERNSKEYVETKDGRKIPFSALSSGQQELFPLLFMLNNYTGITRYRALPGKRLVYIEEPEAHLFPTAQSELIMVLTQLIASDKEGISMLITTHSPYILAKLNNLLKAGEISANYGDKANARVEQIIPKVCWLSPSKFKAYAIVDGEVKSIFDQDGLIDGAYLDDISGEISREFTSLLSIEIEHERS